MFYYYGVGFKAEKSAENFCLALKYAPPLKQFLSQIHYVSEENSEIFLDLSIIYSVQSKCNCKNSIERLEMLFPDFDFNKAIQNLIDRTQINPV